MIFAEFMHKHLEEASINTAEQRRQLHLQQQKDRTPFLYYAELSSRIQNAVTDIMAGNKEIELNHKKDVKLTNTQGVPHRYQFDSNEANGVDLFAHLGIYLPVSEFAALKLFMRQHEIKKLTLYYQYSNSGEECWNGVYATI